MSENHLKALILERKKDTPLFCGNYQYNKTASCLIRSPFIDVWCSIVRYFSRSAVLIVKICPMACCSAFIPSKVKEILVPSSRTLRTIKAFKAVSIANHFVIFNLSFTRYGLVLGSQQGGGHEHCSTLFYTKY